MKILFYVFIVLIVLGVLGVVFEWIIDHFVPIVAFICIISGLFFYPKGTLIIMAIGIGIYLIYYVYESSAYQYRIPRRKKSPNGTRIINEKKKMSAAKEDKKNNVLETLPDDVKKYIQIGERYIDTYSSYAQSINNKTICISIGAINDTISKIMNAIIRNPDSCSDSRQLFDYYLPTIDKILMAYITYQNEGITGDYIEKTKREIEASLVDVKIALQNYLNQLYTEDSIDVSAEIYAMKQKMRMDGLSDELNS